MDMCPKCCGTKKIVIGALLLLNGFVWPKWLGVDGWIQFIAVLMIIMGILIVAVPNKCKACKITNKK